MRKTLEDIAKLAGVNSSTVSRTISNPQKVKLKTRQKIEAIIEAQGYKPNFFAQGLAKGLSDSVGLITSIHANLYFLEIIETIQRLLAADGTYMYLCDCANNIELEKKYLDELKRRKIDGLFVIETPSLNTDNNFYVKNTFDCPVILINQHKKPYGNNYIVQCDQKPGIEKVLFEVKQQKLFPFMLLLPGDKSYSYFIKEKLFKKWRQKNNFSENQARCMILDKLLNTNNEETVWSSYHAAKKFIPQLRPRSILAGNDLMALGVLSAANEMKIPIPRELAIIGVDNSLFARISFPTLSTIDLRMNEVGTKAAELYRIAKRKTGIGSLKKTKDRVVVVPSLFCRGGTF